jgi:hypothetical protein
MMCAAVGRSAPTVRRLQLQVPYLKRCVGPSTIVILIVSFKTKYLRLVSEIPSFISHSSALVIIYIFTSSQLTSVGPTCHTIPFLFPYPPTVPHNPTHRPPIPRTDAPHPLLLRRLLPIFPSRHRTAPSPLLPPTVDDLAGAAENQAPTSIYAVARRLDPEVGEQGDDGPRTTWCPLFRSRWAPPWR